MESGRAAREKQLAMDYRPASVLSSLHNSAIFLHWDGAHMGQG